MATVMFGVSWSDGSDCLGSLTSHRTRALGLGVGEMKDPGKGPSTLQVPPPSPSLCCSAMRDNLSPELHHSTNYPQTAIC